MIARTLAALGAVSLIAASSVAAAQTAQPLSVANSPAAERSGAGLEGESELRGRGTILPLIAVTAIILAILALTDTWPFDEPDSP